MNRDVYEGRHRTSPRVCLRVEVTRKLTVLCNNFLQEQPQRCRHGSQVVTHEHIRRREERTKGPSPPFKSVTVPFKCVWV